MKLLQKPFLISTALIVFMAAGFAGQSNADDVTKNDQQSTTPQTSNDMSKQGDTATTGINDTVITTKVKAAIIAEPSLSAMDIKVSTTDGVVTLSGIIDAADKAERAGQLAQTVDGVKTVNNELVVKSAS